MIERDCLLIRTIKMNSQNYNPKVPVVVAHVCPEANALLQPVLDQWFGDSHLAIAIDGASDSGELMRSMTRGSGKWKKSVRCVSAVFDQRCSMGVPDCLPAEYQLACFIADPFRLVAAEYRRLLRQPNFWHRGQQVDFSQHFPSLDSFMDRYPDWLYSRLPQDLTFANFPHKLGNEFLFVGVLESLQESVDQLANVLGQPRVKLNGDWDVGGTASGSEALRQAFYAQYPRLKAIYDFAIGDGQSAAPDQHCDPAALDRPDGGNVTTGKLDLQHAASAD